MKTNRDLNKTLLLLFFFMAEIYLIYSSLERKAIFTQQDKAGTASCPFVPLPSA